MTSLSQKSLNHSSQSPVIAIVPAAGIGSRMQARLPKQYLKLGGQSILAHTLDVLIGHAQVDMVIVALSPSDEWFEHLTQAKHPKLKVVNGGAERADSVLAALKLARGLYDSTSAPWAMVHDAARPCLDSQDIDNLLASRSEFPQGAILAAPVRDTMKRAVHGKSEIASTVCREDLWHALTPQLFPLRLLMDNLAQALDNGVNVTDEASAMEWANTSVGLVAGRSDNIKVTHPNDLALAELFLAQDH